MWALAAAGREHGIELLGRLLDGSPGMSALAARQRA